MPLSRHSFPICSESATAAPEKHWPVRAALAAAGLTLALALVGCDKLQSKDSPSPASLQVQSAPPAAPAPEPNCDAIAREAVDSSALRSIGYCESGQILELEFTRGTVYRYYAVPAEIHRAFMRAPSKGRYLNSVFKPLGYRYERLR